jgi:hypothetical protein
LFIHTQAEHNATADGSIPINILSLLIGGFSDTEIAECALQKRASSEEGVAGGSGW